MRFYQYHPENSPSLMTLQIWWTRSGHIAGYKTTYYNQINGVRIVVELILPPRPGPAAAA